MVPEGGLIQASDGSFYGTTSSGGTHGRRILQMTPKGRRFAPEEKFGTLNGGTIFRMTSAGDVTTVHRLSDAAGTQQMRPKDLTQTLHWWKAVTGTFMARLQKEVGMAGEPSLRSRERVN